MSCWGIRSRWPAQDVNRGHAQQVRAPAVAGTFYPAAPQALRAQVDQLLAAAMPPALTEPLVALVLPHAGYIFSGRVAATGVQAIPKHQVDVVIMVGVSHRTAVDGAAAHPAAAFKTPLGAVTVDREAVHWLTQQTSLITIDAAPHREEHSLEVELPLLQRALGEFAFVPLVMGNPGVTTCQTIGNALAALMQRYAAAGTRSVLVASSDFSHYPTNTDARRIDAASIRAIRTGQPNELHRVAAELVRQGTANVVCALCGEGAVKTVMAAAQQLGADRVVQLDYGTSADVPEGSADRVVGYAAIAFTPHADVIQQETPGWHGQETLLLRLARDAMRAFVTQGVRPTATPDAAWPAALHEPAAVFITLRRGEAQQLRGCIGTTEAESSLGLAVQASAVAAASRDTRFRPVTADELADLSLEISILSPMRRVQSVTEIEPGRHGVMMRHGVRAGLLLPQVWDDTGWTREQFLHRVATEKAGLAPDAWNDPMTELYVFTVEKFEE